MTTDTLLIEIGTEELPPKSLNRLRLSLAARFREKLGDAELGHAQLECHATPRRLALIIKGLSDQQPEQCIERRGPKLEAAYDKQGNPSKALVGFMKSCSIENPTQLDTLRTAKGDWLVYRATKSGASLSELLPEILESSLVGLPIEKRMRWGSKRAEFVRPIKWLVSLYGEKELPIALFGIDSGRTSMGHRFMSAVEFELSNADAYIESCKQHYVKVDFEARREDISRSIKTIAEAENAELELDPELLDEVTGLVEWPVALKGHFDESFLSVPGEVIVSAMKEHQRFFHLTRNGTLLPTFIVIANIESTDPAMVIIGNERVIRPRLADAVFFYKKDIKTNLSSKLEKLDSVVFQTELGSYLDKANRMSHLASFIAAKLKVNIELAGRAGLLAKADLVSDLVAEFPDLQGIMGGYYAEIDDEPDEVSKAIAQHYRPTQSGGELPNGSIASSVALADKIDTLTGLFGIGQPPTGSRDPFALRRQSLGIIRICIENELSLDISECLAKSAELHGKNFVTDRIYSYIIDRLGGYYADLGFGKDLVEAAIAGHAKGTNLLRLNAVIRALHDFQSSPKANKIVASNKRVANALKTVNLESLPVDFDRELATETVEINLHSDVKELVLSKYESISEQLDALAELQEPIDKYFEQVMVMHEDEGIRNNRLSLLRDLRGKFLEIADFSLIQ